MEQINFKPKPRRKLSRAQITDILERNVSLYKEEDGFIHYLVELAVYLMEYEYDWSESCVSAPEMKFKAGDDVIKGLAEGGPAVPRPKPIVSSQRTPSSMSKPTICPYCGTEVGEAILCPSCRNLTR